MKNKLFSEPAPYAIGLAMAFALLAPTTSSSQAPDASLFGPAEACADDGSCKEWKDFICIHGGHKDYEYRDPAA